MPNLPNRKRLRLPNYNYSQAGYYFITICTKDNRQLLGQVIHSTENNIVHVTLTQTGQTIQSYLEKMNAADDISLERYVIMPNHVHLLIAIQKGCATTDPTKAILPNIVHGLKSAVTRQAGASVWQRSYHEHVVRSEKTYLRICRYIDENPLKWAQDCYYTDM